MKEQFHKIFPIKTNQDVWLRVDSSRWEQVPRSIRHGLIEGTKKLATIRTAIADSAKVSSMPPIEVIDRLWFDKIGVAQGSMAALMTDDCIYYGVRIPAHVAIHKDAVLLRAILVHEFAHCFYSMAEIVKRSDEGLSMDFVPAPFNPRDPIDDKTQMIEPREWFGEYDVKTFTLHDDPRIAVINKNIPTLKDSLLSCMPDLRYEIKGRLCIPTDVAEHVRKLKSHTGK